MIKLLNGDALTLLKSLKSNVINTCITSPPYWGLRDYGVEGQLGLEKSPQEYVAKLVEIFSEVRRVLRDDGTLWLNLGDSYCSIGHKKSHSGFGTTGLAGGIAQEHSPVRRENDASSLGLKHKDLVGVPWRVAFALQESGWYLRQDIIWAKPNPMPESVRDRCTKSHEYLFMLSKSPKYYYDCDAVREPIAAATVARMAQANLANQKGSDRVPGKTNGPMKAVLRKQDGHGRRHAGFNARYFGKGNARTFRGGGKYTQGKSFDNSTLVERESHGNVPNETGLRNRRSVWTITTKPFKEAHFATFPPDLVTPCALAGCPEQGIILDPFAGSGTVGMVANKLNRHAILFELNPDYIEIAKRRCNLTSSPPPTKVVR
jgi:DNA modification methylase